MKLILTILFALNVFSSLDLAEIRKNYALAANSESNATGFCNKLAGIKKEDNKTLVAYKAASIILMSKFSSSISQKIDHFREGSKLLEFAVSAEPNNIEIRLVRLSIQENIPRIVNYRKNIEEDKDFMLTHYAGESQAMKSFLKPYILQSNSFSEQEKKSIK